MDDLGAELHQAMARALLDRIRSGDASAAELEVARKLLKDNGVSSFTAGDDSQLDAIGRHLKALPFVSDGQNPRAG